ncbi:DNA-3-methyladenine glycosylase I [Flavobacteriaceae bacterium Ap0902]|nr:DNA-3-methyladenine glycosylase I [Flavobacteriaceae bacterium Ap0902]
MNTTRCAWVTDDPLYIQYHDLEWGVPVNNDNVLFEILVLESFQAGLSWVTILKKRENFRQSFDDFNYYKVALYDESKIIELLNNPGIVRHRKKIEAAIHNAQCFIETQKTFDSFSNYIWQFTDGRQIINQWNTMADVPANTHLSELISIDLKQRGFKFLGSTTVYAYLQAIGIVNDHTTDCICHPNNL